MAGNKTSPSDHSFTMSRNNEQLSGVAFDAAKKLLNVTGDEFDLRKFDPSTYGFRPEAPPTEVFHSDTKRCAYLHIANFNYGSEIGKMPNFALYTDGACLDNGTPAAQASVGVYGTPGAWYNIGFCLPQSLPQTNQSAEIFSAFAAIQVARNILKKERPGFRCDYCPSMVVLVMDSSYVVKAMTSYVRKWRANGFRNARGSPVVNAMAFKRLDHDIRQLYLDKSLIVRFWFIRREYNTGADRMAAQAFEGDRFLNLSPEPHFDKNCQDSERDSEARCEVSHAFSGLAITHGF